MNDNSKELLLIVTASPAGAVGYGELYNCEIREKVRGNIKEGRFRLSVLAGDREKLDFLAAHPHPQPIEIEFRLLRTGEPYRTMPINGFVDENNTSWEITHLRKA